MIVSHALKFVFFHNPKAAGTSMRLALLHHHDDRRVFRGIHQAAGMPFPLDHAHLRCCELETLFPDLLAQVATYRSLVLVRSPYRRFISAVYQHYKVYWPGIPLAAMDRRQQRNMVEDLVEHLSADIERVVTDYRYVHFSPQTWFIHSEERQVPATVLPVDDTGRFSAEAFRCLNLQPVALPHENASKVDLSHVLGSARVLAFVQAFYKPDLAFLAASSSLAHLAREA